MNEKQPSIFKIIWVDATAFLASIIALVFPAIYIYMAFFTDQAADNIAWTMLGISVFSMIVMVLRVLSVVALCNGGVAIKGTITEIGFFRDRGYVKFIYTTQGQRYTATQRVMKNAMTTRHRHGQEVNIAVDGENPRKAIITEFFV